MGGKPSGPWRPVADGEEPPPLGAYEAAPWAFKYALLYRSFADAMIPPTVVDELEPWQAAAFLGADLPLPDKAQPGARDINQERFEYLAAMEQWEQGGRQGDRPTPPLPDPPQPINPQLLSALQDGG